MNTSDFTENPVQTEPTGFRPITYSRLRSFSLVTAGIGALGSLVLTLLNGRDSPPFLQVGFAAWVLSPFVALAWATLVSRRWSLPVRITLACVTLVIALACLTFYAKLIPAPPGTAHAFVFVATPPAAWLLAGILVPLVGLLSHRRSKK